MISRPVEEVFAVVRNVTRSPMWTPGLLEVRRTSDGPLEVGATMVYVGSSSAGATNLRRPAPPSLRSSRWRRPLPAGPFFLEVDQRLEPDSAGTRLTVHCQGESRGFFKVAEALVVRLTQRQFDTASATLKALLEDHALWGHK